mmetsp:Transcript_15258/g.28087  ORF Transcript_15258/g.28087 Transcript_15258/m.28087 type:complete len:172 (+) Transcript_15258:220-735(+)
MWKCAVSAVMYAFGDKREQLPESIKLMNDLVVEYMEGMTREAMASTFNGTLTPESLQFAIRKDERKASRVQQLLEMFDKVVNERSLHLRDDTKPTSDGFSVLTKKRKTTTGDSSKPSKSTKSTKTTKRPKPSGSKAASQPAAKNKVSQNVEQLLVSGGLAKVQSQTASPSR